jgi:hypothetical protein
LVPFWAICIFISIKNTIVIYTIPYVVVYGYLYILVNLSDIKAEV